MYKRNGSLRSCLYSTVTWHMTAKSNAHPFLIQSETCGNQGRYFPYHFDLQVESISVLTTNSVFEEK